MEKFKESLIFPVRKKIYEKTDEKQSEEGEDNQKPL